ncbi:hypothetical protein B0H11DRAFT_2256798 [Mycena galericulata]|nr:hypothetical protein B0H11DRAFT_2256798 [Mycena galericulata]
MEWVYIQKFSVHWKHSSFYGGAGAVVKMDGKISARRAIPRRVGFWPITAVIDGVSDGRTVKPFMFSSLELTDDDAFLEFSSHEQLGVIDIVICAIEAAVRNVSSVPSAPSTSRDFLPELKVHERSKKAVTQQVTLAKPEVLTNPKPRLNVKCGPDLVTFSFKYRPLDLLQANGITPPPPRLKRKASPLPERAPTPEEDPVDEEELRVLREKLHALEARRARQEKKPRVKSEAGGLVDLTQETRSKRVKLEETWRPFISGEVIDLT